MPKLILFTISGELLTDLLNKIHFLPSDATILKIVPSQDMTYSFDVTLETKKGYEMPKGGTIPRAKKTIGILGRKIKKENKKK